jgi:hypothetical protein
MGSRISDLKKRLYNISLGLHEEQAINDIVTEMEILEDRLDLAEVRLDALDEMPVRPKPREKQSCAKCRHIDTTTKSDEKSMWSVPYCTMGDRVDIEYRQRNAGQDCPLFSRRPIDPARTDPVYLPPRARR